MQARCLRSRGSPAMICWMTGLDRDKSAAASGCNFSVRDQLAFDNRAIAFHLNYAADQPQWTVRRRRAQQLDCIIGRHGAGRMIRAIALHQMMSGGPVAVAIEQRADDA